MISGFGVEHIAKARPPAKRGRPYAERTPEEQMATWRTRRARAERQFARRWPPGEHEIPLGHLRRIGGGIGTTIGTGPDRVERIMPSMRERGLDNPVSVSRLTGGPGLPVHATFNEGNHRLAAAHKLGWKKIRTVVLPSRHEAAGPLKFTGRLV